MATWEDGVPEVVAPAITVNTTTGAATLTWEAPKARTRVIPFGTWSANGALNFDSVRVNDNETTAAAFNWPSGAGTAEVTLDLGEGNSGYYRGVRLCFDTTSVAVAPYTISYSADGSAWFVATPTSTVSSTSGVYAKRVPQWATPASAVPRYWRIARTSGTLASVCTEVWFFGFEATAATVEEVRLYDVNAVCAFVPGGAITAPLNVTQFVTFAAGSFENGGTRTIQYDLTLKSYDGASESVGSPFSANTITADLYPARSSYVVQRASILPVPQLSVGANHNVDIASGPITHDLDDPGGNFSITGFDATGLLGGERMVVYTNSTRTGTFVHESASSLAANRMRMYALADVVMTGPFQASLRYDSAGYWRFEMGRDSTGFK